MILWPYSSKTPNVYCPFVYFSNACFSNSFCSSCESGVSYPQLLNKTFFPLLFSGWRTYSENLRTSHSDFASFRTSDKGIENVIQWHKGCCGNFGLLVSVNQHLSNPRQIGQCVRPLEMCLYSIQSGNWGRDSPWNDAENMSSKIPNPFHPLLNFTRRKEHTFYI